MNEGNFAISGCRELKSLEGAPEFVGGDFYCKNCGKKFTEAEVRKYTKVIYGVVC